MEPTRHWCSFAPMRIVWIVTTTKITYGRKGERNTILLHSTIQNLQNSPTYKIFTIFFFWVYRKNLLIFSLVFLLYIYLYYYRNISVENPTYMDGKVRETQFCYTPQYKIYKIHELPKNLQFFSFAYRKNLLIFFSRIFVKYIFVLL